MRGDGEQHVVGLGGREAECDHSDIDATRIHGAEEIGEGGRGTDVAAEQIGNALIAGASQEGRGGLAAQRVDPEVDNRHAGSDVPGAGCVVLGVAFAAVFSAALAFAARRSRTPVVSDSLIK